MKHTDPEYPHVTYHSRRTFWGVRTFKIEGVTCQDGARRTFYPTAEPDTFFSQPGYVVVKGKKVSGAFYSGDYRTPPTFHANLKGKNAHLIQESAPVLPTHPGTANHKETLS